jgi:hypothetical protein
MKHTLKLLTLSLLAVIFLGCAEANPHLGKWHGNVEGGNMLLEILEGGNAIVFYTSSSGEGDSKVAKWLRTEGGIDLECGGESGSAFLYGSSLLVTTDGKTVTLKRENQ